jgi:putative (di)nucleoside polyphosphate hydrolase
VKDLSEYGYRPAAGVMLINQSRQVWVGQRRDSSLEAWQMPQGGLDPGEDPQDGALRELEEETGIGPDLVEIIARARQELRYDLPEDMVGVVWKEKWRGQRQTWFLARFLGRDEDVNLDTAEPEFRAWKWAQVEDLPALIVPFKKRLYEDVIREFRDWL